MSSELDEVLGERSSLTKMQIERMKVYLDVENTLEKAGLEDPGHVISGVSQGAYYRVLNQGKNNVLESLYTILLCSRMGIIHQQELIRLFDLVSKVPVDSSENTKQVISLIDALVRKIVML